MKKNHPMQDLILRYPLAYAPAIKIVEEEELDFALEDFPQDIYTPVYDDEMDEADSSDSADPDNAALEDEVLLDQIIGVMAPYRYFGSDAADFRSFRADVQSAAYADDPESALAEVLGVYAPFLSIAKELQDAIARKRELAVKQMLAAIMAA